MQISICESKEQMTCLNELGYESNSKSINKAEEILRSERIVQSIMGNSSHDKEMDWTNGFFTYKVC